MSKIKKLSEKLAELDQLVSWFDNEDIDIDDAIDKFDEVGVLATDIKTELAVLENKRTAQNSTNVLLIFFMICYF